MGKILKQPNIQVVARILGGAFSQIYFENWQQNAGPKDLQISQCGQE